MSQHTIYVIQTINIYNVIKIITEVQCKLKMQFRKQAVL